MAWADTTLLELAMPALEAVREDGDAQARAGTPHANLDDEPSHESAPRVVSAKFPPANPPQGPRRRETNDAPPRYRVEMCAGVIDREGRAALAPLGVVDFRQVLDDCPSLLFPVRQVDGVHHGTLLAETAYRLGDPVFFACSRHD
ncbi:unnamed protein product [Phytomonas sp. EM1]|nr:unnamed protein product [Phytomonas sp. EM1]|eukprot:CCW63740.1 unnamed protein product [Phytomonas sp. isolate EM1]